MAESNPIQEGFICPICYKDLRSPNGLITHFQDSHSEEQAILKSIKELYGKAKKKILKLDDQELESLKSDICEEDLNSYYSDSQSLGLTVSHTKLFRDIRRDKLDHRTTETNKLIIRLDRLLRFYGSDRKHQEQGLVTWLDGSVVSRCPSCAASFNITRRQHHCRLCGSIMCNSCSYFLPYETAQVIVAPVHNREVNNREEGKNKEDDSIRICNHCLGMLESRRMQQIEQMRQPIICQLYNHLQNLKTQVQASAEQYHKMYNSLTSGETTYQIQDAQALRSTIAKKAETIDILSKKIESLPLEGESPKTHKLQTNIRRAIANYIKEHLLTLPVLPTVQELERIRQDRSLKQREDVVDVTPRMTIKKVAVTTGWSPASVDSVIQPQDDPLIEQMNIVRNYIEQARKAGRHEEVVSLQNNLEDLKIMYRDKQGQSN